MIFVPFSCLRVAAADLGILVVVGHARLYLEEQHHGVIFVNDVVAVHRPIALKVAEAEEDLHIFVGLQSRDVFARHLNVGNVRSRGADAAATAAKGAVTVRAPVWGAGSGTPAVMAVTEAAPSVT